MKTLAVAFAVALSLLAACASSTSSSSNKPAGATCGADSECGSASCLEFAVVRDGGCSVVGKSCSKACVVDADCASLGAKFLCFAGCGSTRACGAIP